MTPDYSERFTLLLCTGMFRIVWVTSPGLRNDKKSSELSILFTIIKNFGAVKG